MTKKSILEDSLEALIAAIYLDGGFSKTKIFIERHFFPKIASLSVFPGHRDYKTRLQEIYAKKGKRILATYCADEEFITYNVLYVNG